MSKAREIYLMWPSIVEMARDLGESPSELLRRREAGDLPDPRHDQKIIARALFVDKYLRQRNLDEMRRLSEKKVEVRNRKTRIREYYHRMGGTGIVAEKLGVTPNTVRLWCHRARLPAKFKFELKNLSDDRGVDLDLDLFEAV